MQGSQPLQITLLTPKVPSMFYRTRETVDRDQTDWQTGNSFADEFLVLLDHMASVAHQPSRSRISAAEHCHILDVGTGTARIPLEICSRREDIKFTAVDRAPRAIEAARRNVELAGLTRAIRIEKSDASSLPYANAAFDAVISSGLLHHVANRQRVLNEMARVLRPGGLLFVRDTLRGSDASQVAQILSRASRAALNSHRTGQRPYQALLNVDEARGLAHKAGFPGECVRQSGPRHWVLQVRLELETNDGNCCQCPPA